LEEFGGGEERTGSWSLMPSLWSLRWGTGRWCHTAVLCLPR